MKRLGIFAIAILIIFIVGVFVGRATVEQKEIKVKGTTIDWEVLHELVNIKDAFPFFIPRWIHGKSITDTITKETPIGDIHPRWIPFKVIFVPYKINDTIIEIPIEIEAEVIGLILQYRVSTTAGSESEITMKIPKPSDLGFNMYTAMYHDLTFDVWAVLYYKRFGIIGKFSTEKIQLQEEQMIDTKIVFGAVARII
jgi:hypothetical protein